MLYKDSSNHERFIAYFSMEIGIKAEMPTYSGGLMVQQYVLNAYAYL